MPVTEPILTKRIPTAPFGDPKQRHTVGFDEYVKTGGYQALEKALSMEPTAVVNTVKDAIVRGRGGAGFPAGLKWSFLAPIDGGRRYLAINCDEAEPGTFKDRTCLEADPHRFLEGMLIAAWCAGVGEIWIYLRDEYHGCRRYSCRPKRACVLSFDPQ